MADTAQNGPAASGNASTPAINRIAVTDLVEVLGAGVRDFRARPLQGLLFGGIYAVGGWILALLLFRLGLPWLVYPLAAGFALIAPFVATAFYAISRAIERNEPASLSAVCKAIRTAGRRDLGWMALVTGFSLFIWMDIAALLFFGFMGLSSLSIGEILVEIFTTPTGLLFLLIGNAVGAVIAMSVFSFSVISFPMLFDRDVDFVTAMITSVKVVLANKKSMVLWCATIGLLTALSLLSGLVALFVVLPVLGHASWHLYRRAVSPA